VVILIAFVGVVTNKPVVIFYSILIENINITVSLLVTTPTRAAILPLKANSPAATS
jgi:hypothetical protein